MTFVISKAATCLDFAILLGACSNSTDMADASDIRISKPKGCNNDNVFLGRWRGNSTAGRAVLDVLTLKPNRGPWGERSEWPLPQLLQR